MLTAEVAIYPTQARDASEVIYHSIDTLKDADVDYQVDSMKTHLTGTKEEVFESIESMFDAAQSESGDVSMVVTIRSTV